MRTLFCVTIASALLALGLPGCSDDDDTESADCADQKGDDDSTGDEAQKETYLFVQQALSGTMSDKGGGEYELTLNDVSADTVYFSNRPETIAGAVATDEFVNGFDWGPEEPPNAAITLVDADESEDVMVVQLSAPQYDSAAGTLKYTAAYLEDYDGDGLAFYHEKADEKLPASFDRVSVLIDDCPDKKAPCRGSDNSNDECDVCGVLDYGTCYSFPASCDKCYDYSYYNNRCKQLYGDCCNKCGGCFAGIDD